MKLILLGTAAGGGYPQWNCACAVCELGRQRSICRSHASLAVSGTGSKWYLVNATPDVCSQIGRHKELRPGPQPRETPVQGILLTDAELDHTIGLLLLREGTPLTVYAPAAALQALATSFPVRTMLENYASHSWVEVTCGDVFYIDDGSVAVTAFATGNKKPRYADASCRESVWTVGYRFEDRRSGGVAVYAPAIEEWNAALDSALRGADCI
ncbi:MAG TPA: MBL fold metallo-hydrolase, partial [Candidatus Obscuribacterales bacterium]